MITLVGACASESSSAALSIGQCWNFLERWVEDSFADELSNAVTLGDGEFNVRMIEQDDPNVSAVIFVDNAGSDIDEIFCG